MPQLDEFGNPVGSSQKWKNRLNDAGYADPWDAYFLNNYDPATSADNNPPSEASGKGPITSYGLWTDPNAPDSAASGSGEGEGGGGAGGYFPGSRPPGYNPGYNIKPAPMFKAPVFSYPDKFSFEGKDLANEPGYQFRLGQGLKALDQSAAARGNLRTGGQIKAFNDYSQNYASQEFQNAWDRALGQYSTNYGVSRDVFDRNYTGAKDEYAPKLFEWQTLTAAEQRAKDLALQYQWQQWMHENASADTQLNVLAGQGE